MVNLQYEQERFEDIKVVIKNHRSKKDRQYNGRKRTNNIMTNNDLQRTTQKTKDRGIRTPH